MSLRQRAALITGGSRGIGKGIALGLAREGVRVAISYRANKTAAQNALRQIQSSGSECFAVEADATDPEKVQYLLDKVLERFGRLDILVNNVGEFNWKPVAETTLEEWKAVFESNLYSVFYASKAALPAMRERGLIGRDERVTVFDTGAGFKSEPPSMKRPAVVPNDPSAWLDLIAGLD